MSVRRDFLIILHFNMGYWTVLYFQQKASAIGTSTRALIDADIRKYAYPVPSFQSCY